MTEFFVRDNITRIRAEDYMATHYHVDVCQQTNLSGWAQINGRSTAVDILLNDELAGTLSPVIRRPDVVAALGGDEICGFSFRFKRAVMASDSILIRLQESGETFVVDAHLERVRRLGYGISGRGLEIGPLDRPFLDKAHFDILFCDHASTDELRKKYKTTGSFDTFSADMLVDIDIVWKPGETLKNCSAGRMFDYVVASQVMEHVSDPVGWLNEIADCLNDGGRVNLSLPDMRVTFDHCRRPSTAADMISAWVEEIKIPSFRSVFDHIMNVAQPPSKPVIKADKLREAFDVAMMAKNGQYVDVHVHVWNHDSFVDCWQKIEALDLCKLKLDASRPPISTGNEFFVSFVKK